jgi:hypothetical protein
MLSTFLATGLADFRAQAAKLWRELAAPCHERRSEPAERSAVQIQGDAFRHRLHVLLLQACD